MRSPRRFIPQLALAGAVAAAAAATPGVVDPPSPGPLPLAWLALANDDIAAFSKAPLDDHRTHQTSIGTRFGDAAALMIDHSILTDRVAMTRSDELTVTGSWLPYGIGADDHAWVAVGGGARASGHILGREVQDDCHNAQSFRCYDLDYDHGYVTVVAAASATMPWYPLPNAGFEAEVDGVATSWPELYGDAAGRAVLRSLVDDARLWIGARQRAHSGNAQSRTARAVASFERGTWIEFGASWHMWTLCGGIHASDGMARSR